MYKTTQHRDLEKQVRNILKDLTVPCYEKEDIKMSIIFQLKGKRNPDVDNLAKSVIDLLQHNVCFRNDKQITELHLYKYIDCPTNRIIIEYEPVDTESSDEGSDLESTLVQVGNPIENLDV